MKYAIVFSSRTGNTARLAEELKKVLPPEDCIYCGNPNEAALSAPMLLIGYWTDKGDCDEASRRLLQALRNKPVFLFGTAGFGESPAYFKKILDAAKAHLDASVEVLGSFMCQGKMPASVLERYEKMLAGSADTAHLQAMIDNFHRGESHPDQIDLENLKVSIDGVMKEWHI